MTISHHLRQRRAGVTVEPTARSTVVLGSNPAVPASLYESSVAPDLSGCAFSALGAEELRIARDFPLGDAVMLAGSPSSPRARSFLAARPERRLIVLAFAHRLTARTVEALLEDMGPHRPQVGFVSGRDEPGLVYSLAKVLARQRRDIPPLDVFDAVAHELDHENSDYQSLRARLLAPARVKILRAHGEGSHAKLPGLTVCGLLEPFEFDGHREIGCCWPDQRCKRSPPLSGARVVFGRDISAQIVFFLCCNGFNLAQELYPSPVSVALSLIEGRAAAVVAPTRPIVAPDGLLRRLIDRVERGGRLGDIVRDLNDQVLKLDGCAPFAVHGDPGTMIESSGSADGPGRVASSALLPAESACAAQALDEARRWLVRLNGSAVRCGRVLEAMAAAAPEVDASAATDALSNLRRLALYALKQCAKALDAQDVVRIVRQAGLIRGLVQRLDMQLAAMIVDARRHADPFDLLHYDQIRSKAERGSACERCGTASRTLTFGAEEAEVEWRLGVECPVCGPLTEHRQNGLALAVVQRIEPGADQRSPTITLRVSAWSETPAVAPLAALALRFFDKGRDRCIANIGELVEVGGAAMHCSIRLPPDLSPDLHSLRLVACSGLDLAYARLRVAGGPAAGLLQPGEPPR